jgi:hypothetical protein
MLEDVWRLTKGHVVVKKLCKNLTKTIKKGLRMVSGCPANPKSGLPYKVMIND